ncbi:MAG: HypC/HybG/HupF family hydrogenase formation chaperone [Saprospiraceae bacterium]
MCLAIPGKILAVANVEKGVMRTGKVSFGGIIKETNLELLPEAKEGDYVLVHVGVALSVIDEEEANKTLKFLEGTGDMDDLFS